MEVNCRREWKQIKGGALMKQKDVQTCSTCGSQNIGEGEFVGYAQIRKKETMFTSSPVDAYICTDCGNILVLKVRHYEKFKQKPLWLLRSVFIREVNRSNILHIYMSMPYIKRWQHILCGMHINRCMTYKNV